MHKEIGFENIYNQIKDIHGWMSRSDCRLLYNHASKIENGLIVEIGAWMGRSAKMLSLSSPTSQVISVDPFPYDYEYRKGGTCEPGEERKYTKTEVKSALLENLKGIKNWTLYQHPSYELVTGWEREIDLLIIDGDHSYPEVYHDGKNWTPFVKKGNLVLFHDYYTGNQPQLVKAVDELKYLYSKRESFTYKKERSAFQICKKK